MGGDHLTMHAQTWTPWGDLTMLPEDTFAAPIKAANDSFCDRVLTVDTDVKTAIADDAKRIVSGARRAAYGKPEDNFERIAKLWTAHMRNTGRDVDIVAGDVSLFMILMKIARLAETPDHRDSFVDIVGYALTGAEVNGVAA